MKGKIPLKSVLLALFFTYISATRVYASGFIQQMTQMGTGVVVAVGGLMVIIGLVKLVEAYGDDAPGAKSMGIKTLMMGGGIAWFGTMLYGILSPLFGVGGGAMGSGITTGVATGIATAIGTEIGNIIIAIGGGIAVWGAINLFEGYGGDNPASKSQGIKQLVAGAGLVITGALLGVFIGQMVSAGLAGGGAGAISNVITFVGGLVAAIGGAMGIWGVVNLIEGYGGDNPAAKSQGIKQLIAGAGLITVAMMLPGALNALVSNSGGIAAILTLPIIVGGIVAAIGAGFAIWGVVHLIEGYGGDNPAAKSQGIKQFMAGAGLIFVGVMMPDVLITLINAVLGGGGGTEAVLQDVIGLLGRIVVAIGGGLALWGFVNLLEGYGSDSPGSKSQGVKQLMAGVSMLPLGMMLPPTIIAMIDGGATGAIIQELSNIVGSVIFAVGGGLALWGLVNLLEGYGSDSTGSKAQGKKQFVTGCGMLLFAVIVPPALTTILNSL